MKVFVENTAFQPKWTPYLKPKPFLDQNLYRENFSAIVFSKPIQARMKAL